MSDLEIFLTLCGLTAVTVLSRCFFLISEQDWALPGWARRGLRYAPLAALAAVVAPEVLMSNGHLIHTWQDARLFAVAAATLYFVWRRGLLGTIVTGMVVLVPLKLGLGW
jgi:branched-subunit amino acid transport protein